MSGRVNIPAEAKTQAIHDCWNQIGVRGDGSCVELAKYIHCRNCPTHSNAAVRLLDRPVPTGYLSEWAIHFANEKRVTEVKTHSVVVFRIGAEWLALSTSVFVTVSDLRPIHSLPQRRSGILLGLVNVRGELLICVSLREVLGLERAPEKKRDGIRAVPERLLVVSRERSRLVFPADEVHGIVRYHHEELKEVPTTVSKATVTHTQGILSWREKSVGVLDDQLLFQTFNRSLACVAGN